MGRYFGREPRCSRQEIELQAQQAIDEVVGRGRPPAEDWLPIEQRLADMDRELAARAPVEAVPAPPPVPRARDHRQLTVTQVRLPAKASPPARARDAVARPTRPARKPVAAKER